MKIEQFPKTTDVFRLVVDRHGKVLRHLWAGQCFAANIFKQDTEIKDYEEEEINSTQFLKSVISVEYNARDIADLESGNPDRDWSSEKIEIDWGNNDIRTYIQSKWWGTSIKKRIGLAVEDHVDKYLETYIHNDEKRYFAERSFFANNISSINVKDCKIQKVASGTPIWTYEQLLEIAPKIGFPDVTLQDLQLSGIPVIEDGTSIFHKERFPLLWDEYLIQDSRGMQREPAVVEMKEWKPNVMMCQWVPTEFIPLLLQELYETLIEKTERIFDTDSNGVNTFIEYARKLNPFGNEQSLGYRLLLADNEELMMEYHPLLCQKLLDSLPEHLYILATTGYPELQGGVLAPLSNPELLYTSTEGLSVGKKWEDNEQRIIFPNAKKHERFENILHLGENAATRYPVDSPLASQVGLSYTQGFLSTLLENIRGIQYEMLVTEENGSKSFTKGDGLIIPNELWYFGEISVVMDAEDVKCKSGINDEEGFINLKKKDYRAMIVNGMIGVKQIYESGTLIWINRKLAYGFNADFDGDSACIESGQQYPIRVAAKRYTCEFWSKLANPKLTKTFTSGNCLKTFLDSLDGAIVVGGFTNLSVSICNLSEEDKLKVAKRLDAEYYYKKILKLGYLEENPDFDIIDKLLSVVAVGIKVGTDCFKTKTDLQFWKKLGNKWSTKLNNIGMKAWLLDYNPVKDTKYVDAFRMNSGLPIEFFKKKVPVSLADHIAKILLVTGLVDDEGELVVNQFSDPLLIRLNDNLIEAAPLSLYKDWAVGPQSSEEVRIANILFSTNASLMEHYDFNSSESFITYCREIWADVVHQALKGFLPNGVNIKVVGGKKLYSIKEYVPYHIKPLSKWRLANLLWYRFHEMNRNAWRSIAPAIYPFPNEAERIVKEKPGLSMSGWAYFDDMPVMQDKYTVIVTGFEYLNIELNQEIEIFLVKKSISKNIYKQDNNRNFVLDNNRNKIKIGSFNEYRMVMTPCEDHTETPKKDKLFNDSKYLPYRRCMIATTSNFILDGNGKPVCGKFYGSFYRREGRVYCDLLIHEKLN